MSAVDLCGMLGRELDDLHVFYLTDAFHKKCTATGPALFSSVAGVPARFGMCVNPRAR